MLYTLYSIVNQLYFNKKFKKKKPHLSFKSRLPKSYHQRGTTLTPSFTQQILTSCLLVTVTVRARSDLRGHQMQSSHYTDGKTGAQREEGTLLLSQCLAMELPGQAPLPIPVCFFTWQGQYSHSELPVAVTGFFPGEKVQPSRIHTAPPEEQVSGHRRQ